MFQYISTLILGLSPLALPVDCLGYFGTCGLSVQYTQDVRGCQPAHTGRPWLSDSTHRTSVGVRQHTQDVRGCPPAHTECLWLSVCVRVCPSAHTGRPWLSISTHISTLVLGLSTQALPVDCLGDFGTRGLSVQYTQDVRGCQPAHPGRPWLSVNAHKMSVAVRVCPSAHTGRLWLSISTHISMLVLVLSTLALPVDCSGDFGPRGLTVQYTQDVRGCPLAHTGHPCVSVSTHRTSVVVRVCPFVSISTHRTSVAVHQYTYQHIGPRTQHADPSRGLFGTHKKSVAVHQYTYQHVGPSTQYTGPSRGLFSTHISTLILGLSTLALPVDCLGDFGPRGLPVQYTQDVRGCPPACVCPSAHTGRPWLSISTHISTLVLRLSTLALPVDCLGDFGTRGLSVQYTQDVCGCQPAHPGRPWLSVNTHRTSVAVHVCPSAHTVRLWLSISTHISMLVLGLSMLALPVDCSGDFGPRGLSFQYTQDVRRCPSAHTRRPCVSVNTHRTTLALPVDCSGDFGPRGLSVQYTQDVRVSPSANIGHPWLSVCVRVCPSAHTERLWLSISTHINTLVLGLSKLALPMDCLGDFGPRGRSVQYTQNVRGCPPAHKGRPWLSVAVHGCPSAHTDVRGSPCVSLCVRQHTQDYTQDVRGCPSAHTGRPWVSVSTHRTSVGVRQHTQDVCGCPCVSVSTHRTSVAVYQYTYQHVGPWTQHADPSRGLFSTLTLPVDCSGDFGPRGLTVQYTPDVRGCPLAHTRRPCVSVSTHMTSVVVRVCPFLSVSTHRTCVAVHQYTYQHVGLWTQHADPSSGLFGTHRTYPWLVHAYTYRTLVLTSANATRPVDCLGDFGHTVGFCSVHTQDVHGCQPAHTGRPWRSVNTHRTSVAVHVCPSENTGRLWLSISTHISMLVLGLSTLALPVDCSGDFGPRGLSFQYTQDVCRCPSAHTGRPCVSVSTHRTSVAVHQYTYQHVGPRTQHTGPSHGLFG
ncbi:hypothetical protein IGI04_042734 [Brassica rapa subsp. trilocularis]|uniref:Wall-associated receptor kinase galacturonan-binding domain-containing protein n=1 Tax=Brassica rapa subsp. trilocularis TaxID=1813537 RepID=A0ABQ7KHM9_BRACM|nr:hypothetical protein IGI04_042734 [Brassica rapa subsp. trilocularis]